MYKHMKNIRCRYNEKCNQGEFCNYRHEERQNTRNQIPYGMRRNAPYIETNRRQLQGNGTYEGQNFHFMRMREEMREEMMRHIEHMVYQSMQGRRM